MKNKFYKRFLNLSAATLACVAVLAGNAALNFPAPNKEGSQADIVIQAGEGELDGEPGIMPLSDGETIVDNLD